MGDFHASNLIDRRRFLRAAGTASGAGIVGLGWRSAHAATASHASHRRVRPAPKPIPGGIEVAPGLVIHVFAAGDPAVTLPFTGITLTGVDVEPSTITDFNGHSAVAYHVGTARASDGRTYNLETDIRAFEGEYVVDGETRHASFALV
jgi:hypothetical protein